MAAMDLGSVKVKVEPELGGVFAVVIAATRLHEALYFSPETVRSLPTPVAMAWGELQSALKRAGEGR